jgi:hypothetical protein
MEDAIVTVLAHGLSEIGANFCHSKKAWPSFIFLFYFMHKKYAQTVPLTFFDFLLISACRLSSSRPCATGRTSHAFSLWSERRTIPTGSFSLVSEIVITAE